MFKTNNAKALFIILVVIPTFLSIVYNFFIATPRYVGEAKIIVKSLSGGEVSGGLSSLLGALGVLQPSLTGAYLVMNYIQSRDMMFILEEKFRIKEYYSSKDWDFLYRFDPFGLYSSYEDFYLYYKDKVVKVSFDTYSGTVTINVIGKDPEYVYNLLNEIVSASENFVNNLNSRSSLTALKYYKDRLEESGKKLISFSEKIKKFLTEKKTVAPEQEVGFLLGRIAELQRMLISKQMELSTLLSVAPENPKVSELKREVDYLKREIDSLLNKLTGQNNSLATNSVELELMKSELLMLQKEVEMNLNAFLHAQNMVYLQHLFIESVEKPTKPDAPMEPKRVRNVFVVFAISFAIWGVLSLLIAGVKEHRQE